MVTDNSVVKPNFRTLWRQEDARWAKDLEDSGVKVSPSTVAEVNYEFSKYGKPLPCRFWSSKEIKDTYPNGYDCVPTVKQHFVDALEIKQSPLNRLFVDQMESWSDFAGTRQLINTAGGLV